MCFVRASMLFCVRLRSYSTLKRVFDEMERSSEGVIVILDEIDALFPASYEG